MSARVGLARCDYYEANLLVRKMHFCLEAAGVDTSVLRNALVAVKPNLVMPMAPERAVCTHPEFFRAAVRLVRDLGGRPILAECPGYTALEKTLARAGYGQVLRDEDVPVADVTQTRTLRWSGGRVFRRFEVAGAFLEADAIVSLPKLKTHGFMFFSGAVKHFFGTIPGLAKSRWHMRCPDVEPFAGMLLDLYGAWLHGFSPPKPLLHVMDGVLGMQGEGPGPSGTPRHVGVIVAGTDALAVDAAAATVVGIRPHRIPTLSFAEGRGLGETDPANIWMGGDPLGELLVKDFDTTLASLGSHVLRGPLVGKRMKNWFVARPVPRAGRCTLCYQCRHICPAGAISRTRDRRRVPRYDYKKCIRCYCCMEICPEAAIDLVPGRLDFLSRLLDPEARAG
ncbi:MAG: DUF362 domain-containing protein [Desulfatibacillaceae bacterium]